MLDQCTKGLRRRCKDLDRAAAVVSHLRRRVSDAHELRGLEHRGRTVGKLEVQAPADGKDDIGITHHGAAHRAYDR
jgi:hypothetical protein